MELEFIKDKVYYKIFDRTYTASSGIYSKHKHKDAAKLAEVAQNIDNVKNECEASELVILKQVHGANIILVGSDDSLEADGSITKATNTALSIMTADCVPVLFASADGSIIGAAHCGWKSAKADIIANMRARFEALGATDIKAIIGPSIQQNSYEVDEKFRQDFVSNDKSCSDLFLSSKNKNHYMFSLNGYVKRKLEKEKIELVKHIDDDTYMLPEKYPSCRRSFHKGEKHSQNILSTIMIR